MTAEEIVVQALARAEVSTDRYPTTRSVLYRRVGVRQQQLYQRASAVNADWAGRCATADLTDGAVDLADMADPVPAAASVLRVEIHDPGASDYAAGAKVHVVPLQDPDSADAPRVTVRDRVVEQVGTDLDGVTSIKVHYSYLPAPIGADGSETEADLPEPHVELLVVDLALWVLAHAPGGVPEEALAALSAEEEELLEVFDRYVQGYVEATSRFSGSGYGIPAT